MDYACYVDAHFPMVRPVQLWNRLRKRRSIGIAAMSIRPYSARASRVLDVPREPPVTECGYNMNWGGICKEPRVEGAEVCAKHLGVTCAVCGAQAVCDCYAHLGNFECGAPLCKAHEFLHHSSPERRSGDSGKP